MQKFVTEFINDGSRFTLELTPNADFDVKCLTGLDFACCAVVCLTSDVKLLKNPKNIPAITFCRSLINKGYNVILHLPGRNLNRADATQLLQYVHYIGVKNILAVKGDDSKINEPNDKKCDFPYAVDFVKFIKANFQDKFCIGVAGYPDKHPKAPTMEDDLKKLKEKVEAGAEFIVTQVSFKYETFMEYARKCQKLGITVPIIPGVFIITSYDMLMSLKRLCDINIPDDIEQEVRKIQSDQEAVINFGINSAIELITKLLEDGTFKLIHMYIFNNIELYSKVYDALKK